jgi:hypothetical protein
MKGGGFHFFPGINFHCLSFIHSVYDTQLSAFVCEWPRWYHIVDILIINIAIWLNFVSFLPWLIENKH